MKKLLSQVIRMFFAALIVTPVLYGCDSRTSSFNDNVTRSQKQTSESNSTNKSTLETEKKLQLIPSDDLNTGTEVDINHKGIRFNMTKEKILEILGDPEREQKNPDLPNATDLVYDQSNVTYTIQNGVLTRLEMGSSKNHASVNKTSKGVDFSNNTSQVILKYGMPDFCAELITHLPNINKNGQEFVYAGALLFYKNEHMLFNFADHNTIAGITVYGKKSEYQKEIDGVINNSKKGLIDEGGIKVEYKIITDITEITHA